MLEFFLSQTDIEPETSNIHKNCSTLAIEVIFFALNWKFHLLLTHINHLKASGDQFFAYFHLWAHSAMRMKLSLPCRATLHSL